MTSRRRCLIIGGVSIKRILPAAAVLALAACGSSGPAMIQVHGTFGVGSFSAYRCTDLSLEGAQVTITDASGTVLATATLPLKPVPATVDGTRVDEFPYSATVPPEARYGVTVGGKAPYYVTRAEFTKGIDLSC